MTTTPKKKFPENLYKYYERIVFTILFLGASAGWFASYISNKSDIKNALENNTQEIKELKQQVRKMNDYITQQSELNGKIMQFMEMQTKQK
jgi:hypothetical protein